MRIRFLLPFLLLLAACGDDPTNDAGDTSRDVPSSDVGDLDVDQDTGVDSGRDVTLPPDAGEDVATDTSNQDAADDATTFPDATTDTTDTQGSDSGPDAGTDIGADADAGTDTGTDAGTDTSTEVCAYATPVAADAERAVLVGHTNTENPEVPGTDVRLMMLRASGELDDIGFRLDVGLRPRRIEIMPSGEIALVVSENGQLATVGITKSTLTLIDTMTITAYGIGDVRLAPEDGLAFLMSGDPSPTGGIHTVRIACDGTLSSTVSHMPLRLASSLDFLPGDRALLLGGQATFDPASIDHDDTRLLAREGDTWREVAAFDLWSDFTDVPRLSTSPDGAYAIVPNGSPFSEEGNQLMLVRIEGDNLSEAQRLTELTGVREAFFSTDGQTAFATLFEPGQLVVYSFAGGTLTETQRISGIGLADQTAVVRRGPFTDRVLIVSTDASGVSNVASVQIDGPGSASYLGQVDFGDGMDQIPGPIAVVP